MTIRFFILQAHYRSTIDFSNEALQAAEKGLDRLIKGFATLRKIKASDTSTIDINKLKSNCYESLNDDLNSPVLLSYLFDAVRNINSAFEGTEKLNSADLEELKGLFSTFIFDILGLKDETAGQGNEKLTANLIKMVLDIRQDAKNRKDWGASDKIREELNKLGVTIKDRKDGAEWEIS